MKTLKTKIPTDSVATVSCVGILQYEYPLHYGNYFSMYLNGIKLPSDMKIDKTQHNCNWFSVCNFNHENYEEACKRFLTDNLVEITVFKPENLGWLVIAITDERIPEDWYCMWSEQQGYCNGGIHGKNYEEVSRILGKRFGGDENYIYVKPEHIIDVNAEPRKLKANFTIGIVDNTGLK